MSCLRTPVRRVLLRVVRIVTNHCAGGRKRAPNGDFGNGGWELRYDTFPRVGAVVDGGFGRGEEKKPSWHTSRCGVLPCREHGSGDVVLRQIRRPNWPKSYSDTTLDGMLEDDYG